MKGNWVRNNGWQLDIKDLHPRAISVEVDDAVFGGLENILALLSDRMGAAIVGALRDTPRT